ncbi:MAG: Omp28-related outer membrane protein [Prevotella sp.]
MKYTFLSLLIMALSTFSIKASTIGYTNGTISRTSVFRMGSTTKQGQAIRLSKEKLQMLKGKSISAVNIAVGSRNTTGNKAHVFIATSPEGTPIAEGDLSLTKALQWLTYSLDTPYVITGEEPELYIGYTAEIVTTYNMLSADFDADIPGCNYAYKDGEWTDTYGIGAGCANITAEIADAPSFCDIIMARNNLDGYYTAGKDYTFSAKIKNFGTKAVTSFNTDLDIDGKTIAMKVEGVNIQPGASYSITLPELSTATSGNTPITISVNNVNDTGDDVDMSDNTYSENIFFYPADMERNMLVEGFTGQACSNCPAGHSIMNNAISKYAEIPAVVVEHHSGYYPDMFTMAEDMDYLFFYDGYGASTYAPAIMVNRATNPLTGAAAPVTDCTSVTNAQNLITYANGNKPYVSMKMESSFSEATREVTLKLTIMPHTELPGAQNLFNVFLTQDSIYAYQANGGASYCHRHVFRGTVTDNAWGIISDFTPGKEVVWTKTFVLPEAIRSSYWSDASLQANGTDPSQVTWATELDKMHLVAFVAGYDQTNNSANNVYNCIETKIGESYTQKGFTTGIKNSVSSDDAPVIFVEDGMIKVAGKYDRVCAYDLSGRKVDETSRLKKGVYIISAVANGKKFTRKVMVR